jgi:mono/diheme cytochrome c family protein
MSRASFLSACAVLASVLAVSATAPALLAQRGESGSRVVPAESSDAVARGQYIVEDVAMCSRCHTPLNSVGERDRTRWLMGGALDTRSTFDMTGWAVVVPRIAGGPAGTDEQIVQLLMTGISRTGHRLRQPMPQFRMTRADAEAVLAYLKSLRGPAPADLH